MAIFKYLAEENQKSNYLLKKSQLLLVPFRQSLNLDREESKEVTMSKNCQTSKRFLNPLQSLQAFL